MPSSIASDVEARFTTSHVPGDGGGSVEQLAADFDALRAMDEEGVFAGPPDDQRRIDYLPTPAEIQNACLTIRQNWTRSEKRRRFVGDLAPEEEDRNWQPPVIDTTHFRISANRGGSESVG